MSTLHDTSGALAARAHHDLGGQPAGRVVPSEHHYAGWEKRVDALMVLLSSRGLLKVDELRRNIEALGATAYDRMGYYERWMHAITQVLLQRGVIDIDALGRAMAGDGMPAAPTGERPLRVFAPARPAAAEPAAARFAPGDRVRVRDTHPPGHVRTPFYTRGRIGVVERIGGAYANPEELAYGRDGLPARALYRVRFAQRDLWPDYAGPADDSLDVELYEHWLEPAA
ncbi:MAG: nitrile hydratase subunit beta [Burkholderiales bacterium]|nr:nitrile hydratase subunit beta [Burkholderiales bacterium]